MDFRRDHEFPLCFLTTVNSEGLDFLSSHSVSEDFRLV